MDEAGIPMQERADLYERFVMYATGLMTGDELDRFNHMQLTMSQHMLKTQDQ
jgi:hypothetical protein